MPRFPQPRQGDLPVSVNLDSVFLGVDNRRDADVSESMPSGGMMTVGINTRFPNGDMETRGGVCQPIQFNPAFESIQGAGIYSDPNGLEWVIVVETTVVWLLNGNSSQLQIPLPAGVTITERVELVQTFESMIMLRGKDKSVLEWDGNRFHAWQDVRLSAPNPDAPTFLEPPPNSDWAIVVADRVFYPYGKDGLVWSDILDYTRTDPVLATARFNFGEDDSMVAACPYQGNRIVVFKSQSIYFLNNVGGTMADISIDRLPLRVGCVARKTVLEVGGDLFWLAQGGVYRMTQTTQGVMRGNALPVSDPISKDLERVNWSQAHKASACVNNDHYFLYLPMDGSEEPNAVAVFDLKTQSWQGLDYYGAVPDAAAPPPLPERHVGMFDPLNQNAPTMFLDPAPLQPLQGRSMLVTDLFGRRTAFVVGANSMTAIGLGDVDRVSGQEKDIYTRGRSRGYMLGSLRTKDLRTVSVCVSTRGASLSASVETDGQNERLAIYADKTRNRRKFNRHGKPDFALDNSGGNFNAPYREDYTWLAGDGVILGSAGIPLGLFQDYDDAKPVRRVGRWFAVDVESAAGRIRLTGLQAEGLPEKSSLSSKS